MAAHDVNNNCFVIAPIGEEGTDVRRRSDQILHFVIGPVVEHCNLVAVRADKISEPGIITTQIIQHIIDDKLVVADLTGRNPNVFYELAIRHALRRPYVQIIQRGERIPFDVAGVRTIEVDHQDLDSVHRAKKEMTEQIRHVIDQVSVDSPISVAVDLDTLRRSGDPEQRQMADVLSSVADLRSTLTSIEKRLSEQPLLNAAVLRDVLRHSIASSEDEGRHSRSRQLLMERDKALRERELASLHRLQTLAERANEQELLIATQELMHLMARRQQEGL